MFLYAGTVSLRNWGFMFCGRRIMHQCLSSCRRNRSWCGLGFISKMLLLGNDILAVPWGVNGMMGPLAAMCTLTWFWGLGATRLPQRARWWQHVTLSTGSYTGTAPAPRRGMWCEPKKLWLSRQPPKLLLGRSTLVDTPCYVHATPNRIHFAHSHSSNAVYNSSRILVILAKVPKVLIHHGGATAWKLKDRITPHVTNFFRLRLSRESEKGRGSMRVMEGRWWYVCRYVCR